MKKSLLYFALFAFAATTWTACDDDDDVEVPPNQGEVITTVNVALSSSNDAVTLSFRDVDGDGGDDPVILGGTLDANTTYSFSTSFLNESVSPIDNVTDEVREEGTDHFVIYDSGALDLTVEISDEDDDGNPLGLLGTLTTSDAGTGQLQVILRHLPIKTPDGATGGDTDVDVSFPITVE
jgi:hypothetical protein